MTVLQICVYGWAIPDDRFRGKGSGTFVDLTYHLNVPNDQYGPSVGDILNYINQNGFSFVPLRHNGSVVQDKVTISEVTIGIEPLAGDYEPPAQPQMPEAPKSMDYDDQYAEYGDM
jgi:hypothetical protein